jgi:hypothetical protein
VDKASKLKTKSEVVDFLYSNVKVVRRHVIGIHRRLLLVLRELQRYNGLDPFLSLPPYPAMMPCNIVAFKGYLHFNMFMSMNAIE